MYVQFERAWPHLSEGKHEDFGSSVPKKWEKSSTRWATENQVPVLILIVIRYTLKGSTMILVIFGVASAAALLCSI